MTNITYPKKEYEWHVGRQSKLTFVLIMMIIFIFAFILMMIQFGGLHVYDFHNLPYIFLSYFLIFLVPIMAFFWVGFHLIFKKKIPYKIVLQTGDHAVFFLYFSNNTHVELSSEDYVYIRQVNPLFSALSFYRRNVNSRGYYYYSENVISILAIVLGTKWKRIHINEMVSIIEKETPFEYHHNGKEASLLVHIFDD
jgi:hypothetical protein